MSQKQQKMSILWTFCLIHNLQKILTPFFDKGTIDEESEVEKCPLVEEPKLKI